MGAALSLSVGQGVSVLVTVGSTSASVPHGCWIKVAPPAGLQLPPHLSVGPRPQPLHHHSPTSCRPRHRDPPGDPGWVTG